MTARIAGLLVTVNVVVWGTILIHGVLGPIGSGPSFLVGLPLGLVAYYCGVFAANFVESRP